MSIWWFKNTRHIIDNHYIYSNNQHMIVRKTKPILLGIVVRGYMTGSSNTSIWSMYNKGQREMYGIEFRDGYEKNEKLDDIVMTPTTKGKHDEPITGSKIIIDGYLTSKECIFICLKAMELFKYGQKIAYKKGSILVHPKYEFGRLDNKIILIDELHTCDSSRYWLTDSYEERFSNDQEPNKLDKDCVRDWIKDNCDPYTDTIPTVPEEIKDKVRNVYVTYTSSLIGYHVKLTGL